MTRSNVLVRQYLLSRPSRRHVSTSSTARTSTSPQRRAPLLQCDVTTAPKPFVDIPGPLALPMLRHSAHVLPRIGSYHHVVGLGLLEGLRSRYGDLVRLAKGSRSRPVLYVFDPEIMREVEDLKCANELHYALWTLKNNLWCLENAQQGLTQSSERDRARVKVRRPVYESSATEPPRWEGSPLTQQRKTNANRCPIQGDESKAIWAALRALLLDASLLKSYENAFDNIAADVSRRLGELRHAENALNEELETEVYRWALESLGVIVFGRRLGCLDGPAHIPTADNRYDSMMPAPHVNSKKTPEKTSMDDDAPDLCSLSKKSLEALSPAEQLVRCSKEIADENYLIRSEKTLKPESQVFNQALKTFDRHFSLTEQFLNQALEDLNKGGFRAELTVLDKLRPLKQRLLPIAADIMLSGFDPLAQSALSMFYQLSIHAAQQQRAHDETTWAAASVEAGAGRPEMPYVAACAREALRLHPVTGGAVRRSREELVVAGYEVPSGVDIVLAHGVTSKSESQFGRPKAFIPERWCPEGWKPLRANRAHTFASLPFGEACPAEGLVGKMLASLAVKIVDKYRLEWHGPEPNLVTTGVNKIQKPFYFVLQNAG